MLAETVISGRGANKESYNIARNCNNTDRPSQAQMLSSSTGTFNTHVAYATFVSFSFRIDCITLHTPPPPPPTHPTIPLNIYIEYKRVMLIYCPQETVHFRSKDSKHPFSYARNIHRQQYVTSAISKDFFF